MSQSPVTYAGATVRVVVIGTAGLLLGGCSADASSNDLGDGGSSSDGGSPPGVVNGSCGSTNGVASPAAPTSGLCSAGAAGTVTASNGSWQWACNGQNGGTNAMCSAPQGQALTCACDGVKDDTACLQAAINSATTLVFTAKHVCVTKGSISVGGGKTLKGNGATIDMQVGGATGISLNGSNTTLSGLALRYSPNPQTYEGIVIWIGTNITTVTIQDNTIDANGAAEAIMSAQGGATGVSVLRNTITNAGYGVLVNSDPSFGSAPSAYQSGWLIDGNTMRNISADAIELNSPIGGADPNGAQHDFQVTNNDLEAAGATGTSAGFCIGVAGVNHSTLSGNKLDHCKWQCIHIEDHANNILVQGNTCGGTIGPKSTDSSSWGSDLCSGILLLETSHDIQLYDNIINNTVGHGIDMNYTPTAFSYNDTISGNTITNAGVCGISIGGAGGDNINTFVGPINGHNGNKTSNSAQPGNAPGGPGAGSICWGGDNVTVTGNTGN
jgi:hypothetical protein